MKALCKEMERSEDAACVCYEQGFDKALAQVKYFASRSTIDLSRADRKRKLIEILAEEAPTDHDVQEVVAGAIVQLGVEEEGETPIHYPDLS